MNPILIHKSDSTIFANIKKFMTFNLETGLDLTSWQAKFILGGVEKTIDDISSKSFEIILGAKDTKQLRLGKQYGTIILTDSNGNIKTVTNTIPFEVTTAVVENEYQEVDLTIPESSGVDIKLKVGVTYVTSVNGMTGDVNLTIPSIEGLATEQQLQQGLNTKQDKGDYALKEEIPSLEGYVKDTDIATSEKAGIAKINLAYGVNINNQALTILKASDNEVKGKGNLYRPIVPANLDLAVKTGVTTNSIELSEDEKTSARTWLGAVGSTDYATSTTAGVIKAQPTYGLVQYSGILQGQTRNLESYNSAMNSFVVCKGTLDNVLTQYSKTVLTTEADYNALATKDANTLYLIEE